jgi:hypothetical protein
MLCNACTWPLQVCEENRRALEESAKCYKPCASNAALLYFAISDMATINPMYQFSLAAFRSVFLLSIQKAAKSDKVDERVHHLIDHHTYAVFKYASRYERVPPKGSLYVVSHLGRVLLFYNVVLMSFIKQPAILDGSCGLSVQCRLCWDA